MSKWNELFNGFKTFASINDTQSAQEYLKYLSNTYGSLPSGGNTSSKLYSHIKFCFEETPPNNKQFALS